MTEKHRQLVVVLEIVRVEELAAPLNWQMRGAPVSDRTALARAFVAKAAYNMPTTKALVERLEVDETLRRLCGWEMRREVPSESTFSRAFAEFAAMGLPDRVHERLVASHLGDVLVWHTSYDATEIEARERPERKEKEAAGVPGEASGMEGVGSTSEAAPAEGTAAAEPERAKQPEQGCGKAKQGKKDGAKRGPGRPRKREEKAAEPTRLERQRTQTLAEALGELPKPCDVGMKRNSKGHAEVWIGYKMHIAVGDGGIPLAALTTSASVHDSQAAIPLGMMVTARVAALYMLGDSAYDARQIREYLSEQGQVPIIDHNPRRGGKAASLPMEPDRAERYKNRTASERFNSRLKDDHGGRMVRVRGNAKVHTHLMFGLLVVFAEAILGLLP
jgi:hypothetical protein